MRLNNESLSTVWNLNQKLLDAKERLNELQDALQKLTTTINGLPKSQSYESRLEKISVMKVDAESDIKTLEDKLQEEKIILTQKIFESNLSSDERKILLKRYVECENFNTISKNLFFSKSKVFTLHRIARKKFLQM